MPTDKHDMHKNGFFDKVAKSRNMDTWGILRGFI